MTLGLQAAVREADLALAEHPSFGDSSRILARVLARSRFAAALLADEAPRLAPLAGAVEQLGDAEARRVFFDPLVRLALEDALAELEAGQPLSAARLAEVLQGALDALPLGLCESRMPSRVHVGADPPKWLWDVTGRDDLHAGALRAAFAGVFAGGADSGALLPPDPSSRGRVEDAMALLAALLPRSGGSALRHIEAIALLRARLEGGTVLSAAGGDRTPSTIFLSPDELDNPWDLAGCLLHEGLHMKLFDAVRSVALASAPAETVQVPWRDVRWSIVRAVFAYHVYVHLSLFKAAAMSAGPEVISRHGDPADCVTRPHAMSVVHNDGGSRFGRSIDRARFLGERLRRDWSHLLTAEGAELVRWLSDSLAPVAAEAFPEPAAPRRADVALRRAADLAARPVAEAECLVVFSRSTRKVQWLDLGAWLVFELCDGRTRDEVERAYVEAVAGRVAPVEARRQLEVGLDALLRGRLIEEAMSQQEEVNK